MNKGDLIDAVAERTGESRAAAQRMVDAVIGAILDGVRREKRVTIPKFGTFTEKQRKARTMVNPATKAAVHVQARTTVGFSPSQVLRNGALESVKSA